MEIRCGDIDIIAAGKQIRWPAGSGTCHEHKAIVFPLNNEPRTQVPSHTAGEGKNNPITARLDK